MATLTEELTSSDPFAEGSAALVAQIAALPSKAARITLALPTVNAEMNSLRAAAREQGYTLSKVRNSVDEDTETERTTSVKLGPKIEVAAHTRPNRAKDAKASEPSQA